MSLTIPVSRNTPTKPGHYLFIGELTYVTGAPELIHVYLRTPKSYGGLTFEPYLAASGCAGHAIANMRGFWSEAIEVKPS